jgi:hypothetical protein
MESAGMYLQTVGPSGRSFNFADGSENVSLQPALFWFARRTGDIGLINAQRTKIEEFLRAGEPRLEPRRLMPLMAVWWPIESDKAAPSKLKLVSQGRGETPIAVFRSAWEDPKAFYLACKGGSASSNHAHMDAGSFVLESGGVRWALDLGMQDYNSLESKGIELWNRKQESQRWTVYRINNNSHNTLTIDGQLHRVEGHGEMGAITTKDGVSSVTIDLSSVFAGQANHVTRTFQVEPGEHRVRIVDELTGLKPGAEVRWAMVTSAEVETSGADAILRLGDQRLSAKVEEATGAMPAFAVIPADPPADNFNAPNPGRRLLVATFVVPQDGSVRFAVTLHAGKAR